jgi:preprotein translocase subunit SecF
MTAAMSNRQIDFLGQKSIALVISTLLIAFAIYQWVSKGPTKFGIDFVGGTEVVARINEPTTAGELKAVVEAAGISAVMVQAFEFGSSEFSVRAGEQPGLDHKALAQKMTAAIKAAHADKVEILKVDSVGATISDEVKKSAFVAVALGVLGLLVYIAFRFEIAFGLGAVVAVFHDIIVTIGIYLAFGHEINGSVIAAALTILGYSVNDTIVIFDRVREEMRKRKTYDLAKLMNESMNFCLSRTIVTSGLTLLAALSLLVFGGGAIQDLSLFLVVGIIIGSYSTIYIASPVVLAWEKWRGRSVKLESGVRI